jgi:transposase
MDWLSEGRAPSSEVIHRAGVVTIQEWSPYIVSLHKVAGPDKEFMVSRARVRELIEERGAELLFLASYSPELNSIEQAFPKIKNIVRKAGARYPRGARRSHRRGALGGYA